jgi:MFS family permease
VADIEEMVDVATVAATDTVGDGMAPLYTDAAPAPPAPPAASLAAPVATRLTFGQRIGRALIALLIALFSAVLLAPLALALLAALAAVVADGLAALAIARFIAQGALIQAGDAINLLSVASRVGFLAIGYLGLLCALMTLLAGLLGRGQGRLFIIPGALLTASALVLVGASAALCWPLLAPLLTMLAGLAPPRVVALAVALYLILDTVTLAGLLADTHETRRRWLRLRRKRSSTRT